MKDFKTELCEIAYKYGTDKCPQIRHFYTEFYYATLKDRRESIKKVLELGTGCFETMANNKYYPKDGPTYVTGASLYMWRDFFPNAQIYGADILPETVFKEDRIESFLCDETSKEDLINLIGKTGSDIDLFVDDGSHSVRHQIFTCLTLKPLLKKDVIYIIEDAAYPNSIVEALKDYDCHIVRKSNLREAHDRLVVVKEKNA